ncbi:MAG: hypothetical protein ABSH20_26090 [Tepidisphaeraceae bacterium]|jgi:hypothetical protein
MGREQQCWKVDAGLELEDQSLHTVGGHFRCAGLLNGRLRQFGQPPDARRAAHPLKQRGTVCRGPGLFSLLQQALFVLLVQVVRGSRPLDLHHLAARGAVEIPIRYQGNGRLADGLIAAQQPAGHPAHRPLALQHVVVVAGIVLEDAGPLGKAHRRRACRRAVPPLPDGPAAQARDRGWQNVAGKWISRPTLQARHRRSHWHR